MMPRLYYAFLLVLTTNNLDTLAWLPRQKFRRPRPLQLKTPQTAAVLGGVAAVGALATFLMKDESDGLFTPKPGSLEGQTIVVTGGTTGMGLESVRRLALGGANIILTARTEDRGERAVQQAVDFLKEKGVANPPSISYKIVDLDNLEAVKNTSVWEDVPVIDVLLNNAGVMALPNLEFTMDGVEKQMQSNHLGHFALTSILQPKLSKNARIINVASSAHQIASKGLLFDYLWKPEKQGYQAWKSYGQSKLANILFTQELQRRIDAAGLGWTTAALHPGVVATDLGRYMMKQKSPYNAGSPVGDAEGSLLRKVGARLGQIFLKTPAQGATTQILLAAKAEEEPARGQYYVDSRVRPLADFAKDVESAKRLWRESEELTGVTFTIPTSSETVSSS